MVSGFDSSIVKTKTLTITYEDFTTTYDIVVASSSIEQPETPEEEANDYFWYIVGGSAGGGLLTLSLTIFLIVRKIRKRKLLLP